MGISKRMTLLLVHFIARNACFLHRALQARRETRNFDKR